MGSGRVGIRGGKGKAGKQKQEERKALGKIMEEEKGREKKGGGKKNFRKNQGRGKGIRQKEFGKAAARGFPAPILRIPPGAGLGDSQNSSTSQSWGFPEAAPPLPSFPTSGIRNLPLPPGFGMPGSSIPFPPDPSAPTLCNQCSLKPKPVQVNLSPIPQD